MVLLMLLSSGVAFAQKTKVMVMDIKDEIDPPMTRYVDLALSHATEINADIVIIEMNHLRWPGNGCGKHCR